ncbi:MAG: DUF1810 domain-containing protein [candidate division KSB1 bacterium]|nr:DUF1810 domain-containing protein [candidate division KSB1 bacterium]
MWFVFPQLKGLGHSWRSEYYGIADLAEAVAFLAHPRLRERYLECVRALMAQPKRSPSAILGPVDALKLCSSLTLFEAATRASGRSDEQSLFAPQTDGHERKDDDGPSKADDKVLRDEECSNEEG